MVQEKHPEEHEIGGALKDNPQFLLYADYMLDMTTK